MENMKQKTFAGALWKFCERFLAQGVSLAVSILLARLLDPADYSTVSIVTIFFTFANVFITGGLNSALIQKKNADSKDYSTVLFISLIISIGCYAALFFSAPAIANLYSQPILKIMIRVMGLSLPINAIKSVWCAYISSTLQFKKFFFATLGGTLVSAAVGIVMAMKGMGAWALVAQQMTNIVIDTVLLIVTTRLHLVFGISLSRLKVLFKYGWKVFVSSIISTTYAEISPLVIGLKFTANDLSFYTKGKSFPRFISNASNSTLSAVLFPVLSKYQDDKEKLLGYTRRYVQLASFVAFPLMLGFLAVADNFVLALLTEKWMGAVYYIQLYCIVFMFDVIAIGNCETIKALGRSDVYLIMEIIKKSGYFVSLLLFVLFAKSPEILAISSIVNTLIQIIVNTIPNQRLIGYKLRYQIWDLLPNLLISLAMAAGVYCIKFLPLNPWLELAIQIVAGISLYVGLCFITRNKNLKYLFRALRELFSRRKKNEKA